MFIMKVVLQKIMSFLMAWVVLFSTMSFTIDMHYCGDTLVDVALFHKAKGCGMEMQEPLSDSGCSFVKKGCCKEEQLKVKGQDNLQLTVEKISFEKQVFVASFIYSYISLFQDFKEANTSFSEYPPPLIAKKLYKLDEVYLI